MQRILPSLLQLARRAASGAACSGRCSARAGAACCHYLRNSLPAGCSLLQRQGEAVQHGDYFPSRPERKLHWRAGSSPAVRGGAAPWTLQLRPRRCWAARTWHAKELRDPDLHQAGGDVLAEGAGLAVVAGAGRAGHGCKEGARAPQSRVQEGQTAVAAGSGGLMGARQRHAGGHSGELHPPVLSCQVASGRLHAEAAAGSTALIIA